MAAAVSARSSLSPLGAAAAASFLPSRRSLALRLRGPRARFPPPTPFSATRLRRAREGDPEPIAHARWRRAVPAHLRFIHEKTKGRSQASRANRKRRSHARRRDYAHIWVKSQVNHALTRKRRQEGAKVADFIEMSPKNERGRGGKAPPGAGRGEGPSGRKLVPVGWELVPVGLGGGQELVPSRAVGWELVPAGLLGSQ